MNIIIPTIGTRGDVQPYIALALGLAKVGHTAKLATPLPWVRLSVSNRREWSRPCV
jgi:UDP:flavonoid glycosyltransferase YjiC (YdhE family)